MWSEGLCGQIIYSQGGRKRPMEGGYTVNNKKAAKVTAVRIPRKIRFRAEKGFFERRQAVKNPRAVLKKKTRISRMRVLNPRIP